MYSPVQGLWPATRWPIGFGLSGHPGSLGLTGPGALALLPSAIRTGSSGSRLGPCQCHVKGVVCAQMHKFFFIWSRPWGHHHGVGVGPQSGGGFNGGYPQGPQDQRLVRWGVWYTGSGVIAREKGESQTLLRLQLSPGSGGDAPTPPADNPTCPH
jgi:hypothetical protein